jgi:thioredoxin 1
MSGHAVEVSDANFSQITEKGVALVDFWAERCPPCRMQGPIIEGLAERFDGRATIGKFDVDSNDLVPTELGLYCIPTLIVFKDGKELKRLTGLQTEKTLVSVLEKALSVGKESGDAHL